MANIIHSTQKSIKGPWLLERDSIEELDSIIDKHWEKFEIRRKKLLEQDIKEAHKSYKQVYKTEPLPDSVKNRLKDYRKESKFARTSKKIYLILSKDHEKSYSCDSFSSAFRERGLLNETPRGFAVYLESGDITCKLIVDHNTNTLEIDVSPNDVTEVQEFYTLIYNWANKYTPDPIQRFFESLGRRKWFFLAPYSALIFYLFVQAQDQSTEVLRGKAQALLEVGITQSNIIEAVETLLSLETRPGSNQSIQIPNWFWISIGGLVYLIVILFWQPKVILGIGKGINYIRAWSGWQRLVLITIPIFIIGLLLTFFGERTLQSLFP